MLFDEKTKRYKKLLIFIIPLLTLLVVFGFLAYSSALSLFGENHLDSKPEYDIEEYDYHLRSNATDYQVALFEELNGLLKDGTDDLAIAESICKNYVADTYTWNNKQGQWDVGGIYFVHSPSKASIYTETKDTFYGLLDKYQEEYGKDRLLEVSNVEIASSKKSDSQYEYNGELYDCYEIACDWQYTEDSRFSSEISTRQYFQVIKNNDGRFEIVVAHGDLY